MRIPDPKAMLIRWRENERSLGNMSLVQLQDQASNTEKILLALQETKDQVNSPAFVWLTSKYLPNERHRIQNEREKILSTDPFYEKKHLVIDGQMAQINRIIEESSSYDYSIERLTVQLKDTKQAIEKWFKRNRTTTATPQPTG